MIWAIVALVGLAFVNASDPDRGCQCAAPNVRTVLFREADLERECWTQEEIALLYTRRLMEQLIPKAHPTNFTLMLDYIKSCLETVKQMVSSRRAHTLVLTAIIDTFGGYLQAFGLPATRRAYYEGSVSYCDAAQLHEVFNNIKKNLRTDGAGWRQPVLANGTLHLPPLHIGPKSEENACATLITTCESASCPREGHTPMEGTSSPPRPMEVPMPYMDDVNRPGSIALPFKEKTLYSLRSKASSDILVRYYLTAIHCLGQTGDNPGDCSLANPRIVHFNKLFSSWIKTMVLPHLDEDNWYPGFGSVLRILETTTGGIEEEEPEEEPSEGEEVEEQKGLSTTAFYIIVGVGALIALWLIICCVCLFLNFRRKPRKVSQYGQSTTTTSSSSAPIMSTLVSLYCGGQNEEDSSSTSDEESSYRGDLDQKRWTGNRSDSMGKGSSNSH